MRLEERASPSLARTVLTPVMAAAASLALCAILLMAAGAPVWEAYRQLLLGATGSAYAVEETLTRATPLIFTGLSVAVAFRAKLWNIGAEGQFYAGALAAVALGDGTLGLPQPLVIPVLLAGGFAAGAALLIVPALLKTQLGVDEVVTTLLLNFVALLFVSMLLDGPLKDPASFGWPQSRPIADDGLLPKIVSQGGLHAGFCIALAAAALAWFVNERTIWGFETKAVGHSATAAAFAGMPVTRIVMRAAIVSGGLSGLGGAVEVAGLKEYLTLDMSPGFGYTGIVIATLALLNPWGVVVAAILVAGVYVGAGGMSRSVGVPSYIADIAVALSLLTTLVGIKLTKYRLRRG